MIKLDNRKVIPYVIGSAIAINVVHFLRMRENAKEERRQRELMIQTSLMAKKELENEHQKRMAQIEKEYNDQKEKSDQQFEDWKREFQERMKKKFPDENFEEP